MGQPAGFVAKAIGELRAARDLEEQAQFVVRVMLQQAAEAAAAEGLSVRQFAEAAISKSHAGRALKLGQRHIGFAVNPADADSINALVAIIRHEPYEPGARRPSNKRSRLWDGIASLPLF
jgi:hypothetical protein